MALMGVEVLPEDTNTLPTLPKPKKSKHGQQRHDTYQALYPQAVSQQTAQQRSAPVSRAVAPVGPQPAPLPFNTSEVSLAERRKSLVALNPLAQNPSPSASTFDFELPSPSSIPEFRQSMMGTLNFNFDEIMDSKKKDSECK